MASPSSPSPSDSPPAFSSSPPPPPSPAASPPPPSPSPSPAASPPPPSPASSPPPPSPASLPPPESSPPPPESKPEAPPPAPSNDSSSPPPPSSNDSSSPSLLSPPPPAPPPPPSSWTSPPGNGDDSRSPPPPPPPHRSSSHVPPPPPRSLSQAAGKDQSSSSGSPTSAAANTVPLVIGVVAGVGLLLLVAALLFFTCARKKKKSRRQMYVGAQSPGSNGNAGADQYYAGSQRSHDQNRPQNGATNPNNHVLNVLPPPPAGGSWPAPPPPPPQLVLSSGDMSSTFSGPLGPVLPPPPPQVALGFNQSTFTYDELVVATAGFAQANLLGQGGFGYVHKGVLPNGKEIAVKSLKSGSGQGDREFQAEVEIISRVHHRHLVSLVGYCIAGGTKMLVYEFLPNNNLEVHLHEKARPPVNWASRMKIAVGSAKGLAYLHEDCHPRIIHRDIKTSNILLDFNFEAKVADFGLAKLNQDNYTHVSTRVMGTFGYLAPEYASSGKLTEKSDVFSFGVVLLELITGRRPVDTTGDYMEDSLVDWARPLCLKAMEDGNFDELADPRLENNYVPQEMARMVASAAASIRHSARSRPKMSQIVRALEGDVSLEDLNEGVKPGQSSFFGSSTSENYDAGSYSANMRKFRKTALDSQEYGSSEYGATSEYGLDPSSSSDDSSREIGRKGSRLHINPF